MQALKTSVILALLVAGSARAAIVNSVIVEDSPQRDGRRWVRERHTDHTGQSHDVLYMAEAATNAAQVMQARATQLASQLAQTELQANIGEIDADDTAAVVTQRLRFQHSTPEQLGAEIRSRYQQARGLRAARIAEWLLTLTDAQLRTLFGLTQTQVTQLKTRLTAKVTALTTLRNQVGE